MPLAYKLFTEDGRRAHAAELRLNNIAVEQQSVDDAKLRLAKQQQMIGDVEIVPAGDAEALEHYEQAQRRAASMSDDIITCLRDLMYNSGRQSVRLHAAEALWEIASRVKGGSGKAGPKPGVNVVVIDKGDLVGELDKRRREGTL